MRKIMPTLALCFAFCLAFAGVSKHASAANKAEADEGLFGPRYEYVELDPIVLPIIDDQGVSQVVNLIISLEVENISFASRVERLQPKLTDAFIQDMYGVLAKQAATTGGLLQLSVIKKRLLDVSNQILADDKNKVHDVLLQMIDQRRI